VSVCWSVVVADVVVCWSVAVAVCIVVVTGVIDVLDCTVEDQVVMPHWPVDTVTSSMAMSLRTEVPVDDRMMTSTLFDPVEVKVVSMCFQP